MTLSQTSIKTWSFIHRWSSLVCTVFLLLLCITGLPLIFHHEIDELIHTPSFETVSDQSQANLNAIISEARAEKPDWLVMFLAWDKDVPMVSAILGPTMQARESEVHIVPFDSRTGKRLSAPAANEGFMYFLLELHASLLMGLPGTLFLGFIGFVFLIAVISGVVVYAPFMRRLPFGAVRKQRNNRIKWLDTHNMVGIVALGWISVVGITGTILTFITPITAIWQQDQLASMSKPNQGTELSIEAVSPEVVMASVLERIPEADVSFIAWPNSPFATPHHYTVALRGGTPLTERLVNIAKVDASTGEVISIGKTPWYISAVNLSVPLHFGDYGGLALKIIWALFDIATIIVLSSGLYLWLARGKKTVDSRPLEMRITEGIK